MEAWREELYHYGVKGMKWRRNGRNRVSDSGTDEDSASLRYWKNNGRRDTARGSRMLYETHKMMKSGASPESIHRHKVAAKNTLKVARYERDSAKLASDRIRKKRTKNPRVTKFVKRVLQ